MGRKKRGSPTKLDASKRQCLAWNMLDLQHDVVVVDDNDPALSEERLQASMADSAKSSAKSGRILTHEDILLLSDTCLCQLIIHDKAQFKERQWHCELASFIVDVKSAGFGDLSSSDFLRLFVQPNDHIISFQKSEGTSASASVRDEAVEVTCSVPPRILGQLKEKAFVLENGGLHENQLTVRIYLVDGLTKLKFGSEGITSRKVNACLQELMAHFHGFHYPDYKGEKFTTKHSVDDLFDEIRKRHQESLVNIGINPQHASLRPRLRQYQQDAVLWMLSREHFNQQNNTEINQLHDLYQEFIAPDGQLLYYNRHGGLLVKEKPLAQPVLPGGILADEMGLGKTVEVLACMLCHPRSDLPPLEKLAVAVEDFDPECEDTPHIKPEEEHDSEKKPDEEVMQLTDEVKKSEETLEEQTKVFTMMENCDGSVNYVADHVNDTELDRKGEEQVVTNDCEEQVVTNDCAPEERQKHSVDEGTQLKESEAANLVKEEFVMTPGMPVAEEIIGMSEISSSTEATDTLPEFMVIENEVVLTTEGDNYGDHNYAISPEGQGHLEDDDSEIKCGICGVPAPAGTLAFYPLDETDGGPSIRHIDFTCTTCIQEQEKSKNVVNEKGGQKSRKKKNGRSGSPKGKASAKKGSKTGDNNESKLNTQKKKKGAGKSRKRSKASTKYGQTSESNAKAEPKEKNQIKGRRSRRPTFELVEEDQLAPAYFDALSKPAPQKRLLECVCGAASLIQDKIRVQCGMCGQWQHAECVHYDLTDPYRGIYKCPHCHVASTPIPSGATLIVSPASISYQWVDEIKKHIHDKGVKMLVYEGVHKNGFIQPQTLANHDIVIVSYETLRKEIDYVDLPHSNSEEGRRFRHPKRFMAIPSPIVAVEWWRVCLDEAQMVECTTTKTAEMALRLAAVNRWCVTGTPVQRGIADLFGLLLFLRTDPYWVQAWWRKLLYVPFCYGLKEPLHQVLSQVLWRTSKKHVLDQICLPAQAERVHGLTFTPIEEHFYRSQYQRCSYQVNQSLRKCPGPDEMRLNTLDRYTLHMLLNPMTSLRQACCHPNAVRGDFKALNKANLTMDELLINMTKKARLECEEAHRQYVFANNALAALDLIDGTPVEAVEKYREVLRSADEHKPEFRTDELQLLHTLANLEEILQNKPAGVPPTLRDGQLASQCKEIKEKYLTKAAAFVKSTEDGLAPVAVNVRQLLQEFKTQANWWLELLHWVQTAGLGEVLVTKVKDDLTDNRNYEMDSMVHKFRDIRGLQYIMATQLTEMQNCRDKVLKTVQQLSGEPSKDLVVRTTECCLRPVNPEVVLRTCPFCRADEDFEHYENKLFFFTDKGITGGVEDEFENDENVRKATNFFVSTKRKGTWADSETETALKSVISFCKGFSADRNLLQHGSLHIKVLEELKKEYKHVHRVFMALKENVATYDELDMATTRLRLRLPEEPVPEIPQPNILEPMELDAQRLKFNSDRIISTNELKKKLGQLLYLKNLAKTQGSLQGGKNPEPCPICQAQLGNRWSVLQCGHCFCLDCIEIMMERYPQFRGRNLGNLKCAICRNLTPFGNISYVSTRLCDTAEENAIKVKGDHSTKVVGVVRCLLEIQQKEPDAKCLVFSTWQAVLDILSRALDDNNITYKSLMAHSKFQSNLWNFKQSSSIQVLLLPVHSGSNGLNLIEATHVLFMEPILNSAQELQAIGRVHRIGQTRPTYVHRFIVKGTIEDRMHRLLSTVQAPTNSHNSEETNMTLGDLKSLFEQAMITYEENDFDQESQTGQNDSHGDINEPNHNNECEMQTASERRETISGTNQENAAAQTLDANTDTLPTSSLNTVPNAVEDTVSLAKGSVVCSTAPASSVENQETVDTLNPDVGALPSEPQTEDLVSNPPDSVNHEEGQTPTCESEVESNF